MYELNKLTSLPMCGFIAQLVEHRNGIAEVTGLNPVEALIFFRLLSNCLNWKIYCDDHSSLSFINYILEIRFRENTYINSLCMTMDMIHINLLFDLFINWWEVFRLAC